MSPLSPAFHHETITFRLASTQFFGKEWIAGAAEKATNKDAEIAKAHDDEWLVHQKNIHLKKLRTKYEHKRKVKEEDVGRLISAELAAEPGAAKEVAARALGSEKAVLQAIIDEERAAHKAADDMWERRRALRNKIEQDAAQRKATAQEAVAASKRLKAAATVASAEGRRVHRTCLSGHCW